MADCDDGYTRIANDLLDALLAADLSKHQYKVALAVVRKTYGFNKKSDRITNSQIAKLTGLPETRVCTAKNQLIDMQILKLDGRRIGPNNVISEWKNDIPRNGEVLPETGSKSFPKTGNEHSPKQGNTKDNIQKTENTKSKIKSTCAEPAAADSSLVVAEQVADLPVGDQNATCSTEVPAVQVAQEPVAILLPLNTGASHPVTIAFAAQMKKLYPAVDVDQELRAMCGWLIGNPTKRKTPRGIGRFITSWLSRCQDKGGSSGLVADWQKPAGTLDVNDTSWTKYLQEGF